MLANGAKPTLLTLVQLGFYWSDIIVTPATLTASSGSGSSENNCLNHECRRSQAMYNKLTITTLFLTLFETGGVLTQVKIIASTMNVVLGNDCI